MIRTRTQGPRESAVKKPLRSLRRGAVRLLFPAETAAQLPTAPLPTVPYGFFEPAWQARGAQAHFGRGGACRIEWPTRDGLGAFWRPFRHGGLLGKLLGSSYATCARLEREILDALRLERAGIRVARPLVGRAERRGLVWQLGLVSEYLEGQTLAEALDALEAGPDQSARQRVLLRLAGAEVRKMHRAGFQHPDLHPGNLFVTSAEGDAGQAVTILDLTGGSWGLVDQSHAARASLVRCARWWQKHRGVLPEARAVLAFLAGYEPQREARQRLFVETQAALRRAIALRGRGT